MVENPFEKDESQLEIIVRESGLVETKAEIILHKFQDYFSMAAEWERKARQIVVTSEDQEFEIGQARAGRLLLKKKRLEIESTRKDMKEDALREGKAIDGIANVLKALIIPIEDYLEKQENFAENKRKERELAEKQEQERIFQEAERARIAKEDEEREKIRLENERLKEEAQERILEQAMERKRQEEELAKERKKAEDERLLRESIIEADRIKREAEIAKEREAQQIIIDKQKEKEAILLKKQLEEIAKKNAELAKAKKIADDARVEADRLRKQIICPECGHKFNPKETK